MQAGPEDNIFQEGPPPAEPPVERSPGGLIYECINCSSKLTAEQLNMTPEIKCPFCGYRILRKVRPPIVKHLKAR